MKMIHFFNQDDDELYTIRGKELSNIQLQIEIFLIIIENHELEYNLHN